MGRIATIVAIKEIKMDYIQGMYREYSSDYSSYELKAKISTTYVSSLNEVKETIGYSIGEISFANSESYYDTYYTPVGMRQEKHWYHPEYHYEIENSDDEEIYKVIVILDTKEKEVCRLNIYNEERTGSKEVKNNYYMDVVTDYFTQEEKDEINDLCRNGDMKFELWRKYDWKSFWDSWDEDEGEHTSDLTFRENVNIKLMPTTKVGFDFIKKHVNYNRGFTDSADFSFWIAGGDSSRYTGELLKCNNGHTPGLYK